MEIIDTHTHTWYSGHGQGTPEEVVASASALGLSTVALTEHLDLPTDLDPEGEFGMTAAQVPLYIEAVKSARNEHPELEVILGIEIDWRSGAEDYILERIAPYELLLGSVHMFTGEPADKANGQAFWPFDYQPEAGGWQQLGLSEVWHEYLRLWLEALDSKVPFTVMAHPDLPKKLGFAADFDAAYIWQQMADAASAQDVMIELNTAGLFAPCKEAYPGSSLLHHFCQAGVPCTISSDAHKPDNVGRAYAEACAELKQAGYKAITVPRQDGDRREILLS